jgi:nitroreductase
VIDKAVQIAAESPSACNRQPFEFRVFDDPELVQQVAEVPMGTGGYVHNIPCVAVLVGDLSAFFDERDRHLIYIDGCLAAMAFVLGLESQGVATCCINWPDIREREERMQQLLGLKQHERPVMLIAIGYADPNGKAPFSARRRLEDVRSYNKLQ